MGRETSLHPKKFSLVIRFFYLLFAFFLAVSFLAPLHATEDSFSSETDGPACSPRFNIFAAFLLWTAREAGADAWAEAIVSEPSSISNDLQQVDFRWDPGFRVGLGYFMKSNPWDTKFYYTRFHTTGKDDASRGPGSIHSTFLGNFYVDNPLGLGISGPSYESASINWRIHYDIFDWELGCRLSLSKSLVLRPFVGVKGGWINQHIHTKWNNPDLPADEFFNEGIEDIENDFWGIGPDLGIDTKWILGSFRNQAFSLFGDFSGALMWGHWSFSDEFSNDLNQKVDVNLQDINSGATMVRAFMGLGWDAKIKKGCKRVTMRLGYEMQFWFNQLQYYSFTGGRLDNQLTLQGGTLEFCLDF